MAELTIGRPRRERRSLPAEVGLRIWRFFCSVRAAMWEIVFLALLVLIGTLKGSIIPAQIPRFVPALDPLVRRWYAFDVFHSLIFSLTLALIAIAIVVCTINRIPGIWRSIAQPTVRTTRHFFDTAEPAVALRGSGAPDAIADEVVGLLRRRRYRVLTERDGETVYVYADKHRFGKLGTFPFHLGLILVLVGGIVGSEFGFREMVFSVPEGGIRDVGRGTGLRLGLDRFVDTYTQIGSPTAYRSDVVLYDGAEEVRRASIDVNKPLRYKGVAFYQSSYGQAAAMRVTDGSGAVVFDEAVPFDLVSKANMNAPAAIVELPAQGVRLELIFPNVKLDAKPEIGQVKLQPGELWAQARDARTNRLIGEGTVIAQGDAARLADLDVQFVRERRFTLLQVAYNPGIPILVGASLLIVVGMAITFAFPHRRLRGLVEAGSDGARVLLAPLARRDWGAKHDFARTMVSIEQRFGPATVYGREAHVGD